jgi:bla regulator protein BlaR1
MLPMLVYVLIVGMLLGAAALAAEYAANQRESARRWIWMTTIVASLLLPLMIATVTIRVPDLVKRTDNERSIVLRDATSVHVPMAVLDLGMPDIDARPHRFNALFRVAWLASSLFMLAGLILSGCLLYGRKRRWTQENLCGTSVLVAPDAGPAVVGLLRPCIVVPAWLPQESTSRQQFVIAHGQSHLDARSAVADIGAVLAGRDAVECTALVAVSSTSPRHRGGLRCARFARRSGRGGVLRNPDPGGSEPIPLYRCRGGHVGVRFVS